MRFVLPIILVLATVVLIAYATLSPTQLRTVGVNTGSAVAEATAGGGTPEAAVSALLADIQRRDWDRAYARLANTSDLSKAAFIRDVAGTAASLRNYASLESWDVQPIHESPSEATVRAALRWSTAVGQIANSMDLTLAKRDNTWKAVWPLPQTAKAPTQVIPVNYLRWDIVTASGDNEWGQQNLDAPHVRIISMNAVNSETGPVIMGEIVNEDTVPAFVNVNAALIDANGNVIDEESSFDKISHILLPKQVSPYRVDFPGFVLDDHVKSVRMDPKAVLAPASADPVIAVLQQALTADGSGRRVLQGQLMNQSGQVVNISHAIATFYDKNGKVIWVSDGYVDRALFPQTPENFSLEVPDKIAGEVQSYHVVVNQYTIGKS